MALAAQCRFLPSRDPPSVSTRPALIPAAIAVLVLSTWQPPASGGQPARKAIPGPATDAARDCGKDPSWSKPTPPRRIFGNSWYVGTCGITAVLVTSPKGHVLIDAGPKESPQAVEANIRALGFRLRDVRIILNTHEHLDHAGGISRLQRDTGAKVLARAPGAGALKAGVGDRRDPQYLFSSTHRFPAVANVHVLADGANVTLGPLVIRNVPSPGHTAGGSSWIWRSCEGSTCRDIVFADSITAISDKVYRYSDHPRHVAAFRDTLETLEALPCDILLTAHPDASELLERLDGKAPLVAADACKALARHGREVLDQRLVDEANGKAP